MKHIELGERPPFDKKYHDSLCKRLAGLICRDLAGEPRSSISILDVGSGRGELLRELHRCGFRNLYALDMNPECVKLSSEVAQAKQGDLSQLDALFDRRDFDYITLSHVLEHVTDPVTLLKRLKTMAQRGLVVAVPNLNSLMVTVATYIKGPFKVTEGHLYGWDASHLKNLLTVHAGFQLLKWEPDTVHIPGRSLRRALSLFGLLDWLQFKFLPKLSPFLGPSLIVLCKATTQENETTAQKEHHADWNGTGAKHRDSFKEQ